jgi:hypothetical protein
LLLQHLHLLRFEGINWRQVVLDDLILPVVYCSVSLFFLCCIIVLAVGVQSSVVLVVTQRVFTVLLSKWLILAFNLLLKHRLLLLFSDSGLLPFNEVLNCLLLLKRSGQI